MHPFTFSTNVIKILRKREDLHAVFVYVYTYVWIYKNFFSNSQNHEIYIYFRVKSY